jgi:GH24 family phage-related lysozyme (muramidase)
MEPSGQAAGSRPIWFEPALKIVAEFEGCHLKPYLCAAGVPTQGYGRTGKDISLASAPISQAQADKWLAEDLQHFADGIHRLLPGSQLWGANQQAALISWSFNVGLGAVESSTLRKRLLAGEPGIIVVLHRTSLTVKFALMKNAGDSPIKRNVTSAWNCASLLRKPALNSVTSQSSLPADIGQKM